MSTDDSEEEEKELPVSGSFFNSVPPPKKEGESSSDDDDIEEGAIGSASLLESDFSGGDMEMFEQIIKKTQVSRSGGGKGFGAAADFAAPSIIQTTAADRKDSFVGIGKPLNDIQNPEYDENGYTLYADETTGEKKRVFEALVDYPSVFKMKIVGKDDPPGTFAPEMVSVVAESCGVDVSMVKNTQRKKGKWTSVTVHAPVKNADMLYQLYENVDKDPRVKFKF